MTQGTVEHRGLEFHQVEQLGRSGGGWSGLGVVLAIVGFIAAQVIAIVGFTVYFAAVDGLDASTDRLKAVTDVDNATPAVLLFVNLSLIAAIPITWGLSWLAQGLRPAWLSSVRPGIRWKWLAVCFLPALGSLVIALLLGTLLPVSDNETVATTANTFTSTSRDFLLVIVLTTPLQAVAEEYVFRGYLTQAFGGLVRHVAAARYLAVLGPALIFALFHGAQSPAIFFDRFAFGVVAGILVIATGGIEAGIAYHVLNNLLAFGIALFFGDISAAFDPESASNWDFVLSFVKSAVFVVLAVFAARKMGIQTRTGPGVLESPGARV